MLKLASTSLQLQKAAAIPAFVSPTSGSVIAPPSRDTYLGEEGKPGTWTPEQVAARAGYNYLRSSGVSAPKAWMYLASNRNARGERLKPAFKPGKDYMTFGQLVSTARAAQEGSDKLEAYLEDQTKGATAGARFSSALSHPEHGETLAAAYNLAATPQGQDFIKRYQDFNKQRLQAQFSKTNQDPAHIAGLAAAHNSEHSMALMQSLADLGRHLAPNGTLDDQRKAAFKQFSEDVAALERLQSLDKNPEAIPDEADVTRAYEIEQNPYRKAAVARALHSSEVSDKQAEGAFSYNGKSFNPKARSYDAVYSGLGEQLQPAKFYMANKDILSDLNNLRSGDMWSNLLWVFKTLFTNPSRFYKVVNALNYGNQKGHQWNKLLGKHTGKYANVLPWLNVVNNVAGGFAPTNEHQTWG